MTLVRVTLVRVTLERVTTVSANLIQSIVVGFLSTLGVTGCIADGISDMDIDPSMAA